MIYLLDANIFIQAKNEYYGFDLCPGFWDWLKQQNNQGKVFSIEPVQDELTKGDDDLAYWARTQGRKFFLSFDQDASLKMGEISQWVQNAETYKESAKRDFLSTADPLLVAYAKAHNYTVVSHEVYNPHQRRKVNIPTLCDAFGVPHIRTFEMLRREGATFVLPASTNSP